MVSPDEPRLPDSRLLQGRYQRRQMLGGRSGQQTWLAQDVLLDQLVVLKLFFFGADSAWSDLQRLQQEAQVLQSLWHLSIPRYLDQFELDGEEGNGFAFVQTYFAARSLEQHLRQGRVFSEPEFVQLALSLLDVLIYLHERCPVIVHRDVKPSNVLVLPRSRSSTGEVYLVDFGSVQSLTASLGSTVSGTYGYTAPEVYTGMVVPASDLYSLGMTLICLATGRDPMDLPSHSFRVAFEPYCSLSPYLVRWLQSMTASDLAERFQSARSARQALLHSPLDLVAEIAPSSPQTLRVPSIASPSLPLALFSFSTLLTPAVLYILHVGMGVSISPGISAAKLFVLPYILLEVAIVLRQPHRSGRLSYLSRSFLFAASTALVSELLTYLFFNI